MKISVLTLFPKMISGFFEESIVKRAQDRGLIDIKLIDLRDFAIDDYGTVDDRTYGGGVGMVMRVDVIYNALQKAKSQKSKAKNTTQNSKVILTSPKGKLFTQQKAQEFSKFDHLVIIAGHYEGVDQRVLDFVDEEISLGDFVITGGEITAVAIADSVVRLRHGVLKKEEASVFESFMNVSINRPARRSPASRDEVGLIEIIGDNKILRNLKNKGEKTVKLLEYPQYTRPEEFMGKKVPEVLLSGNHKEIEKWRIKKAFEETAKKRPDLLK
ncbi:tRNA (guanosine(37)-N1)-methyltransferase TrmD [Candidatus Roizmanbacteria bacterium]|nr:tRNA (guanosine(37)-N1)-methyltransferase TrmD [Candidatus Roizmanbacteria bacterium]